MHLTYAIFLAFEIALAALTIAYYLTNSFFIKKFIGRYKVHLSPGRGPMAGDVSIVIPVYKEPEGVLRATLESVRGQAKYVYVSGASSYRSIVEGFGYVFVEYSGRKRNVLSNAMRYVKTEYVMFLDSDTAIAPNLAASLRSRFTDGVGGVGSNVKVRINGSLASYCGEFFARLSSLLSISMSYYGNVLLLNGVCSMYRTGLIRPLLESDEFINPRILGIRSVLGDDRQMTNYIIKRGYRAVIDFRTFAVTEPQPSMLLLAKQLSRWTKAGYTYFISEIKDGSIWSKSKLYIFNCFYIYSLPVLLIAVELHGLYPLLSHSGSIYLLERAAYGFIRSLQYAAHEPLIGMYDMLRIAEFASSAVLTVYMVKMTRRSHMEKTSRSIAKIMLSGLIILPMMFAISIVSIAGIGSQDNWLTR